MNREEAIKVLSSYDVNGVWADVDGKPYNAEEQAQAFDMAIEALKQEPREGEWVDYDWKPAPSGVPVEKCGNCGEWSTQMGKNFCPNCGARME